MPRPMPCSPVQVPSIDSARSTKAMIQCLGFVVLRRIAPLWRRCQDENCRRRHGRRSAHTGRSHGCPPWSRSCSRQDARSAHRRPSTTAACRLHRPTPTARHRVAPPRAPSDPPPSRPSRNSWPPFSVMTSRAVSTCSPNRRFAAVKFEKQHRRFAQTQFRRVVDRAG